MDNMDHSSFIMISIH